MSTIVYPILVMFPDRVIRFGVWSAEHDHPLPPLHLDPNLTTVAPHSTIPLSWEIEACALLPHQPVRWRGKATRWELDTMVVPHDGAWDWVSPVLDQVRAAHKEQAAKEQEARARLQAAIDLVNLSRN